MTAVGQLVAGRYRVVRPLAAGGLSRVWLATDDLLRREVAIKQCALPDGLDAGEQALLRRWTLREARAFARVEHRNVIRIIDVVPDTDLPWIVMEYVPSRSLSQVVEQSGPLPPERVAAIGLAVLDGLAAIGRTGVLHLDVKPGNVLIGDDGRVVLGDFGPVVTEQGIRALSGAGIILGSPNYIAPERLFDHVSTAHSDLWSLGATLYYAVEGRPPYLRADTEATLQAIDDSPPQPPRRAGPLTGVLTGLLQRDPAARLSAAEARERLRGLTGGRGAAPQKAPARATLPRDARPRPALPGAQPQEAEPRDARPQDAQPRDARPGEARPRDARPGEARPRDAGPGDAQPQDARPQGAPPQGAHPQETHPHETHPQEGELPEVRPPGGGPHEVPPSADRAPAGEVRRRPRPVLRRRAAVFAAAAAVLVALATAAVATQAGRPAVRWTGAEPLSHPAVAPPPSTVLPPGFTWWQVTGGFRVAAPSGWRPAPRGSAALRLTAPDGAPTLQVSTWTPQPRNVSAALVEQERDAGLTAYRRVRIDELPGAAGAVWEYTYRDAAAGPMRGLEHVTTGGGHTFRIQWRAPRARWQAALPTMDLVLDSFGPRPGA